MKSPDNLSSTRAFRLECVVLLLACFSFADAARAQTLEGKYYVTDGSVDAIARDGSNIYIAGEFQYVGPPTGAGAPLDATSGLAQVFAHINNTVYAVEPDGAGGWYIGGDFSRVLGQVRFGLAHILAGGTLSPWNPSVSGTVRTMKKSGSILYVGGSFTGITAGGILSSRSNLAALDATTGDVLDWNPGANSIVYKLTLAGGLVYVGGNFGIIKSLTRFGLAAIDPTTGIPTAFNGNLHGGPVRSFDIGFTLFGDPSILYVGGGFTTYGPNNTPRQHLAAFDLATGNVTAWNPVANGEVWAVDVVQTFFPTPSTNVYVGGDFSTIQNLPRFHLAKINGAGVPDGTWTPQASSLGGVFVLRAVGANVYAGGLFSDINGASRRNLVALDATSGTATAWPAIASGPVQAIEVSGSQVFVGGEFVSVGGKPRQGLAALDVLTGQLTNWDPKPNGTVNALVVSGSTLYAGGAFTMIGVPQVARNHLAALSTSTGVTTGWNPGANATVTKLLVDGTTIYVAGTFTLIGAGLAARNGLAALNVASNFASLWDPAPNSDVLALAVDGSIVYAGGNFTHIGGATRHRIAALSNSGTGQATNWDPDVDDAVHSIVPYNLTVYLGGVFSTIGGAPRSRLGAVLITTGKATSFQAEVAANPPIVEAMVRTPQDLVVGGWIQTVNGVGRRFMAAVDPLTGQVRAWNPGMSDLVRSFLFADDALHVGGVFHTIGSNSQASLGVFTLPTIGVDGPIPGEGSLPVRIVPNPAVGGARVEFTLPRSARVSVRVIDLRGREVARLVDGTLGPGPHEAKWDAGARARIAPGVYFVRIEAEGLSFSQKFVLIE